MKTAERIIKNKKVNELEIEPDIFVTLNYGYQLDGAHCFGEDTLTDVIKTLSSVEPCDCESCKAGLAEQTN
jgi:hypothetical protein